MKKIITTLISCTTVAFLMAPVAFANTPDGETPAEETECDPLTADGVSKGLYGLCVAFCEAQDADEADFPRNPETSNRQSGIKVLENYRKKMSGTDPDMPCLAVPCPCWEEEEVSFVTAVNIDAFGSCATDGRDPSVFLIQTLFRPAAPTEGGFATTAFGSTDFTCQTRDQAPFLLEISQEEYDACTAHIINQCAFVGDPYP